MSPNRLLVQSGIYNEFVDKFCLAVSRLKVGEGFTDGVNAGPLITQDAVDKVHLHSHSRISN